MTLKLDALRQVELAFLNFDTVVFDALTAEAQQQISMEDWGAIQKARQEFRAAIDAARTDESR